jgi:hypothetical protein
MLSGTLPIVSFYAERRTTQWVHERAANDTTAA